MEIKSSVAPIQLANRPTPTSQLLNLRVGQLIQATVIKMFPETGQMQLELAGRTLQARSSINFTQGRLLELEVVKTGDVPQLKILNTNPSKESVNHAIRAHIGTQTSSIDLSQKLISILDSNSRGSSLSEPVRKLAANLVQALPQTAELSTATGLKRAIENSGIFLEAKLLALAGHTDPSLNTDLKTKLLNLLDRMQSLETHKKNATAAKNPAKTESAPFSTPEQKALEAQTKGALSKIVLDQLTSLPEEIPAKQSWNLEIPFIEDQQAALIKLKIDREQSPNNDSEVQQWTVFIDLNPPKLGRIQAKITLTEHGVNAYFRAAHENTDRIIQNNLAVLREQFRSMGLNPGELGSRQGQFDVESPSARPTGILDEKA